MWLVPSPTDWGTWPLFAAVLVQWHQSWCSGRLLQWQHQQSELPNPSPGPPRLQVQINAGCLHPAPPGDCQTGTSSEHCRSLPPQVCKAHTHIHTVLILWIYRMCCLEEKKEQLWAKRALLEKAGIVLRERKKKHRYRTLSGLVIALFVLPNCFLFSYTTVEVPFPDKRVVRVENLGKSQGDIISSPCPCAQPSGSADTQGTFQHCRASDGYWLLATQHWSFQGSACQQTNHPDSYFTPSQFRSSRKP